MGVLQGYRQFGGINHETGVLRNVLAHYGVTAPHTGEPFSETMLLGIGGGVGFLYMVFELHDTPYVFVGGRYHGDIMNPICQRLGIKLETLQTGSKKTARKHLLETLADDKPAIVWVASAGLPYYGLPVEMLKWTNPVPVIVYGYDDDAQTVTIADLPAQPQTVVPNALTTARAGQPYIKNRLMVVEPPEKLADLAEAIRAGIRATCHSLQEPPISNGGLLGMMKWADMLVNTRNKKGWHRLFTEQTDHLYESYKGVYLSLECEATSGSAFRGQYADFLEEAAIVLGDADAAHTAAGLYRESALLWHKLALSQLLDTVEPFRETRELLTRKQRRWHEHGGAALADMKRIDERLAAIKAHILTEFPLSEAAMQQHWADLRDQLLVIHEVETRAVAALQKLVE